ncbi:hypothetical protein BVRB_8g201440 [Beta vulgaris subsp. vulgaris]|uniref:Uncharacterized protein n=1 Tax=Beta vulgaris subsp. vulgaris TaxID=3555 RepID=A0A0J8B5V3_BETVV|nr:hypothetical protein BVRB_8g201440 [Beta vulgaris subsp. vulgaris]
MVKRSKSKCTPLSDKEESARAEKYGGEEGGVEKRESVGFW